MSTNIPTSSEATSSQQQGVNPSSTSSGATTNHKPGLSDIFAFQYAIAGLITSATQALNDESEAQYNYSRGILAKMQEEMKASKKLKKEKRRSKNHSFFNLGKDIGKLLGEASPVGLATEAIKAGVSGKSYDKQLKESFSKTMISIAENPDLGPTLKVLTIATAALMICTALATGGGTLALAMILMTVMTQIPMGKFQGKSETGMSWTSAGVSQLFQACGVPPKIANTIADGIVLATGVAAACVSPGIGLMVLSSELSSLSQNIANDVVGLSHLKGKERAEVKNGLSIGLSVASILIGVAGCVEVSNLETNVELSDRMQQLVENNLVHMMTANSVIQMAEGTLKMAQSGGDILIALINKELAKIQAHVNFTSNSLDQANSNIENLEKQLSTTINNYDEALVNSQKIPTGLTSFHN